MKTLKKQKNGVATCQECSWKIDSKTAALSANRHHKMTGHEIIVALTFEYKLKLDI